MPTATDSTHPRDTAARERSGMAFALGAYVCWGLFPLFFSLLDAVGAVETLAHRIVWSLLIVLAVLGARGSLSAVPRLLHDRRSVALLTAAAVLIAINWGVFIYAVNASHVIEGSLGYFIAPLMSAAFGMLVFGERLRSRQALALGLASAAVLVLAVDYGHVPWIALTLAASFASYGVVKKLAGSGAAEGLAVETLILVVPAAAYLVVLESTGHGSMTVSPGLALLLVAAGPVTALPLLLFSAAVTRIRLTVIGILQYLLPTLQFLCGLVLLGEPMAASQWIGFGLVWVAIAIVTADVLRR